ncbi:hypothetical protein [Pseudoroseomonas ludipueritiae]|uniref:Uncharacterized protein n=1 Tax=Pseudoroseomonas ludipueritiae TaxID=198093 RepID=A0ABR7R313_9PROT|nr:hypothetical protein [Pseudoroseomonas ludipueritiae]MBC9176110.1 hypothetical protein [Pseudoroseomonas ludipueritiae]
MSGASGWNRDRVPPEVWHVLPKAEVLRQIFLKDYPEVREKEEWLGTTMSRTKEQSKERRWIVLSTDGRYVTLGYASDPFAEELRNVENALRSQGLAGWLAVMEGNPHVCRIQRMLEVKPLADPGVPFDDASAARIRTIRSLRAAVAS